MTLGTVGLAGNIFAIRWFTPRRNKKPFIKIVWILAIVDLCGSLSILNGALELFGNVYVVSAAYCKTSRSISFMCLSSSMFLLSLVSIERYNTICRPFGKQMSMKMTMYIIALAGTVLIAFSVLNIFTFDKVTKYVQLSSSDTLLINICEIQSDTLLGNGSIPTVLEMFGMSLAAVSAICIIVTYTLIVLSIYRHIQSTRLLNRQASHVAVATTTESAQNFDNIVDTNRRTRLANYRRSEIRATLMMLVNSTVLLVSFVPYFVFNKHNPDNLIHKLPINEVFVIQITVWINNIMNPIVYFIMHADFRSFVKNSMLSCKRDTLN